jgi:hypothetical protein
MGCTCHVLQDRWHDPRAEFDDKAITPLSKLILTRENRQIHILTVMRPGSSVGCNERLNQVHILTMWADVLGAMIS